MVEAVVVLVDVPVVAIVVVLDVVGGIQTAVSHPEW